MSYLNIASDRELHEFLVHLKSPSRIAFDTEFVSEGRYTPQLCLVQIATDRQLALIDPLAIDDMTPFWEAMAEGAHETIVHAGRGELEFSFRAVGKGPANLFDTQIAAGLTSTEYPSGFRTLVSKLLNRSAAKAETRTDWRKRPLSERQIQYALDDVRHLLPMRDRLDGLLQRLGRFGWLDQEMGNWQREVEKSLVTADRWRRVSGSTGLGSRQQAIVREIWRWREEVAFRRDCPPRRVLRDDLIIELAKRQSADPKRITAVRGLQRGDLNRVLPKLVEAIQRALDLPDKECPRPARPNFPPQFSVLGQFMFAALTSICRQKEVAAGLVGTANDVRELIAHHLNSQKTGEGPRLARGWRAEVVGNTFEQLLDGKTAIRVEDPASDHPLAILPLEDLAGLAE